MRGVNLAQARAFDGWGELRELTLKAEKRGLSASESFAHFTGPHSALCTAQQLYTGSVSLGLHGVTYEMCNAAVARYGHGAALNERGFSALLGLDISPPMQQELLFRDQGARVAPVLVRHELGRSRVSIQRPAERDDNVFFLADELVQMALAGYTDGPHDDGDRVRELRTAYRSPYCTWFLRIIAGVCLLIGALEDIYVCVDESGGEAYTYPENCTAGDQNEAILHAEAWLLMPIILGSVFIRVVLNGVQNAARDPVLVTTALLAALSWLFVVVDISTDDLEYRWPWYARAFFRPWFLLDTSMLLREILYMILVVHLKILAVLFVLFFAMFWFVFIMMGVVLIPETADDCGGQGPANFTGNCFRVRNNGFYDLHEGFFSVFWWVTGNNSPLIGAQNGLVGYKSSPVYGFYWTAVTFVILLGILSIAMAVVYNEFSDLEMKRGARTNRRMKKALRHAFALLGPDEHDRVSRDNFLAFCAFENKRSGRTIEEAGVLFGRLDKNHDGMIDFAEFLGCVVYTPANEIVQLRVNQPWLPGSAIYLLSKRFRYCFDIFVAIQVFVLFVDIYELADRKRPNPTDEEWGAYEHASVLFFAVYTLEANALMLSFGPRALYAARLVEGGGEAITKLMIFFPALFVALAMGGFWGDPHAWKIAGLVLALRTFLALKIISQLRVILDSLLLVVPKVAPLFTITICLLYSFTVAGISLFGGEIVQGNQQLQEKANSAAGIYVVTNFNSIPTGIYTLIMTIAGNNISTIAESMLAVQSMGGEYVYLILYLEITLVLVNVLVSYFIDAYTEAASNLGSSTDEKRTAKVVSILDDDKEVVNER